MQPNKEPSKSCSERHSHTDPEICEFRAFYSASFVSGCRLWFVIFMSSVLYFVVVLVWPSFSRHVSLT